MSPLLVGDVYNVSRLTEIVKDKKCPLCLFFATYP